MKILAVLSVLVLTLFLALPSLACTLDGKWKSHKTKTLAELYGSKVSNSQKMKLAKVYGKTIIEYSNCDTMVVHANGAKTQHNFETIEDSNAAVIIKDAVTGDMNMLVKEGDCYKIPVKGMAFYEHFCRM